jgi:DNA end-binding protein Ku
VAVPVKAYPAVRSAAAAPFHFLHVDCGQRIRYQKHCPQHGPVPAEAIVRGYEYTPDHHVLLQDEELDQFRPARDKALQIDRCSWKWLLTIAMCAALHLRASVRDGSRN